MINGMKPEEPLLVELARGSTTYTLQQFTDRVEVYMRKEEAIRKLENVAKPLYPPSRIRPEEESSSKKRKKTVCPEERNQFPNQKWTLLNANLSAVFKEAKKDLDFKPPSKMRTPSTKRSNQKYCEYHRDHGDWTKECLSLEKEIEMFIRQGKLKEFVAKDKSVGNSPWKSP
jgi:hypothetical protein